MIEARPLGIVCINKWKNNYFIIDVVIPGGPNIVPNQKEKADKYLDLRIEIQKLWNVKVIVVPVIIGCL